MITNITKNAITIIKVDDPPFSFSCLGSGLCYGAGSRLGSGPLSQTGGGGGYYYGEGDGGYYCGVGGGGTLSRC